MTEERRHCCGDPRKMKSGEETPFSFFVRDARAWWKRKVVGPTLSWPEAADVREPRTDGALGAGRRVRAGRRERELWWSLKTRKEGTCWSCRRRTTPPPIAVAIAIAAAPTKPNRRPPVRSLSTGFARKRRGPGACWHENANNNNNNNNK